jgi:hypothetical protein
MSSYRNEKPKVYREQIGFGGEKYYYDVTNETPMSLGQCMKNMIWGVAFIALCLFAIWFAMQVIMLFFDFMGPVETW